MSATKPATKEATTQQEKKILQASGSMSLCKIKFISCVTSM